MIARRRITGATGSAGKDEYNDYGALSDPVIAARSDAVTTKCARITVTRIRPSSKRKKTAEPIIQGDV